MAINSDKPQLWKDDIGKSVDLFNTWFLEFAPKTFSETRTTTTEVVKEAIEFLGDLRDISPTSLRKNPKIVQVLRMCTAPPIARDRLIGLSNVNSYLVLQMEKGVMPPGIPDEALYKICEVITRLLDKNVFPWITSTGDPDESALYRASTIVADRLTGAISDPLIRNAQERRQLALLGDLLHERGYWLQNPPKGQLIRDMEPGTYSFRLNIPVGQERKVNIPVDAVIKPHNSEPRTMPILIEAKSAGDFTNTNKRRKEEATKIHQLQQSYGKETQLILLLAGYFDAGYLGYEAAEGLDWVWEHRLQDVLQLGI